MQERFLDSFIVHFSFSTNPMLIISFLLHTPDNHCCCHCHLPLHLYHVLPTPPSRSPIKGQDKKKRGLGPCPLERLRKKWFSFSPRAARALVGEIGDLRFTIRVFCPLYFDPRPPHSMSIPSLFRPFLLKLVRLLESPRP